MPLTSEQKWLRAGALLVIASGLAVALAAYPPTAGFARVLADLVIWPLDGAESLDAPVTRLLAAIAGGVLAGWGIALWLLAGEGIARAPELSRRIILGSIGLWFAVDSTGSALAGAPANILGNLAFLAIFVLPILARRRAAPA